MFANSFVFSKFLIYNKGNADYAHKAAEMIDSCDAFSAEVIIKYKIFKEKQKWQRLSTTTASPTLT